MVFSGCVLLVHHGKLKNRKSNNCSVRGCLYIPDWQAQKSMHVCFWNDCLPFRIWQRNTCLDLSLEYSGKSSGTPEGCLRGSLKMGSFSPFPSRSRVGFVHGFSMLLLGEAKLLRILLCKMAATPPFPLFFILLSGFELGKALDWCPLRTWEQTEDFWSLSRSRVTKLFIMQPFLWVKGEL